jgi:D-beta-D-heptose 7-phosphate kinase/D-beta-D-heptose 1-phosphate adenosyltransferase
MSAEIVNAVRNGFTTPQGQQPRVLVVGDQMLDRYLWGDVERISPEAPVPVVRLSNQTERLGGGANVAANLAGLGIMVMLAGYVGEDADAERLRALALETGIQIDGLIGLRTRSTTTKTRVISGHQQMMRIDQECLDTPEAEAQVMLIDRLVGLLEYFKPNALILSDYGKGVLNPETCSTLISKARGLGIPVLVDPKGRDYSKYRGATTLTPNQREAADVCNTNSRDAEATLIAAKGLLKSLELEFILVTRGEHGIALVEHQGTTNLPAIAQQVFDVSGAGDTVMATLTAGLLAGLNREAACRLANHAAGVVVGKVGTVPIQRDELLRALERVATVNQAEKICSISQMQTRVAHWRAEGKRIVFTNGCFDLLHAGHVTYLEAARRLGDVLILGLNTDRSIRTLKGPTRPVVQQADRARVLAALESVDALILFDEDTPLELILTLKPDVIVKGDDYSEENVVGGVEAKAWGGRVDLIPVVAGRSTSSIISTLTSIADGQD